MDSALQSPGLLVAYGVALVMALVASFILGARFRPEGRRHAIDDVDSLAWIAGGAARYVDTVVTRLLARDALVLARRGKLEPVAGAASHDPRERRLLTLSGPFDWSTAHRQLADDAVHLARKMAGMGLMATPEEQRQLRLVQAAPLLAVGALGGLLWVAAMPAALPLGQTILTVAAFGLALLRFATIDLRTAGGLHALGRARENHDRIRRAPAADEMALGVALFGTAVLAASPLDAYHQMRTSSSGDGGGGGGDNSSSDSSGCGGGGCGGGGCGS